MGQPIYHFDFHWDVSVLCGMQASEDVAANGFTRLAAEFAPASISWIACGGVEINSLIRTGQ